MGSHSQFLEQLIYYRHNYNIMKVLVAIAVVLVATVTLPTATEACGDETSMTACELIEMSLEMKRPSRERARVVMESVQKTGCTLPQRSKDRRAVMQQVADMLQCIMDKCEEQGEETCVAEDKLTEAKKRVAWAIDVLSSMN